MGITRGDYHFPEDTDLVAQGAQAMRTLATDVDDSWELLAAQCAGKSIGSGVWTVVAMAAPASSTTFVRAPTVGPPTILESDGTSLRITPPFPGATYDILMAGYWNSGAGGGRRIVGWTTTQAQTEPPIFSKVGQAGSTGALDFVFTDTFIAPAATTVRVRPMVFQDSGSTQSLGVTRIIVARRY